MTKKRVENQRKLVFLMLVCVSFTTISFAQDSIPVAEGIEEKNNINFQDFFFKAITNKAIHNYQKAIENLEECNAILPEDKAVLFELSKNYYKLNRYVESIEFGEKALALAPKNVWIAEHLVRAYASNNSIDKAIEIQEKLAQNYPKKKEALVYLYIRKKDFSAAKELMNELAERKMLSPKLRNMLLKLRQNKFKPKGSIAESNTKKEDLESEFITKKSFSSLQKLLQQLDTNNDPKLLLYSTQGMTLFPAQPLVYLMNGRAHNKNKNYKEAIQSLENGIDFVIDNPNIENDFYKEFIKSYSGLGDKKSIGKYKEKLRG